MSRPGFYGENRFIAYPLTADSTLRRADGGAPTTLEELLPEWIVDACFTFYPGSGFDAASHSVRLASIERMGTTVYLTVVSDAPELENYPLVFARTSSSGRYALETVESAEPLESDSFSSSELASCPDPLWEGTLVTGDLSTLFTSLGDGQTLSGSETTALFEPSLLTNLDEAWVSAIHVAVKDRGRAADVECLDEDEAWSHDVGGNILVAACLRGAPSFVPGFNCEIRQNDRENSIRFQPRVGAGEGEPCGEVAWFAGDAPAEGSASDLFSGSFRCDDVLRSLNGVGGPAVPIDGGQGVEVSFFPDENKVVLDVTYRGMAVCVTPEAEED